LCRSRKLAVNFCGRRSGINHGIDADASRRQNPHVLALNRLRFGCLIQIFRN